MLELEVLKVDVFTDEPLAGNPAAVVLGADALDEMQMRRIATEMALRSTAFVLRSRKADIRLRYFTPLSEEPICGHSTIGSIWSLAEQEAFGSSPGGRRRLETMLGILPFRIENRPDGGRLIWMTQKRPLFSRVEEITEVASALGIGADRMYHEEFPLSRASTGIPCLLVPLRSLQTIEELEPRQDEIIALGQEEETTARIARLVNLNEYKRRQAAPGIKITPLAFGKDRRMPITNRYCES